MLLMRIEWSKGEDAMITYRLFGTECMDDVLENYERSDWSAYLCWCLARFKRKNWLASYAALATENTLCMFRI